MTTRQSRTAEEWASYLEARKPAVQECARRLAAGEDEVTVAHDLGFLTRQDLARRIQQTTVGADR